MKTRIVALCAILAVFGLAIAAYAYNKTSVRATDGKASCCKKSDSCPMKGKAEHEKSAEHVKAEHQNCCGDSCPMKAKSGDQAKADCCCCCCSSESCPLKKKGETKATVPTSEEGKNCCDNCDCCKGKHDTAV